MTARAWVAARCASCGSRDVTTLTRPEDWWLCVACAMGGKAHALRREALTTPDPVDWWIASRFGAEAADWLNSQERAS